MSLDTGLKYNIFVGLGLKGYNIESMESNLVQFSSLKIDTTPLENLHLNFFLGKAKTLGYSEFGYVGFQFHRRANFEYIGYKDISGMGAELSSVIFDRFEPHIYLYSPNQTNIVSADTVFYYRGDEYYFEFYFGVNTIDLYNAYTNDTLLKRFGVFTYANFGKIEFVMGLYSPDTKLYAPLMADDFYFHVSERIRIGYFEQVLSVFSRPSSYNGYIENISNDIDVYASAGICIDRFGAGLENTATYSTSYTFSDKIGAYTYFDFSNLIYKLGFYYTLVGDAFTGYGFFLNISGNI
ncbi:MAG: hypothetical protein ACP5QT_04340 [Brevinematia bacterium]